MAAVAGILFTEAVGLPPWWKAGAEQYPIDNKTLILVEIATFAVLEGLRARGWEKTGEVRVLKQATVFELCYLCKGRKGESVVAGHV